jgi:nucleotide sugar dehydrogenase
VNDAQPQFVVKLVERALGSLEGKKIAALGLSYKPNVDDLRESPAVEVVHLLQGAGASVKTFEPFAPNATLSGLETVSTLKEALAETDAILLLVAHSQFKELDAENIAKMMSGRIAVDAINGWDVKQWQEAGFELTRLGVGK